MFPSLHPNLDVCYTYIATELRLTYGPCSQQGHDGWPPTSQSCLPKTSVVQRKIWNTGDVARLECVGVCSLPFLNPVFKPPLNPLVINLYLLLLSLWAYGSLLLWCVHKFLRNVFHDCYPLFSGHPTNCKPCSTRDALLIQRSPKEPVVTEVICIPHVSQL